MDTQESAFTFKAKVSNVKIILPILKSIQFKQNCICTITKSGLIFTVEESKSCQANAYLNSILFSEYDFTRVGKDKPDCDNRLSDQNGNTATQKEEECLQVSFGINYHLFLQTLTIYFLNGANKTNNLNVNSYEGISSNSKNELELEYNSLENRCLELIIGETPILTHCRLSTYEPELITNFGITKETAYLCRIIIKSEALKQGLNIIDTSNERFKVLVHKEAKKLVIASDGPNNYIEVEYPKDMDIVESFQSYSDTPIQISFKLKYIQYINKVLSLSVKTLLRITESGILSLQFMIPTDKETGFVEYYCNSLEYE